MTGRLPRDIVDKWRNENQDYIGFKGEEILIDSRLALRIQFQLNNYNS